MPLTQGKHCIFVMKRIGIRRKTLSHKKKTFPALCFRVKNFLLRFTC